MKICEKCNIEYVTGFSCNKCGKELKAKPSDEKLAKKDNLSEKIAYINITDLMNLSDDEIAELDISSLTILADKGNVIAQIVLGDKYLNGEDVKTDLEKAFEYFMKAAKQGMPDAQWWVGTFYEAGKVVDKNPDAAFSWYMKAAEQNDVLAIFAIGECYYNGIGVKADKAKAFEWYYKAAQKGDACSQWEIGTSYELGHGVEESETEAFKWYMKSAEQNYELGQNDVGRCFYYGIGTERNVKKAYDYYLKSSDQGNSYAQYYIGIMYYSGDEFEQDDLKAFEWFSKAAKQDNPSAQVALGKMLYQGHGVNKDPEKAYNMFLKAAEKENADALFHLGIMLSDTQLPCLNYEKAFEYLLKAVEYEHSRAHIPVAVYYFLGRDNAVQQDFNKAEEYLKKCLEIGDMDKVEIRKDFISLLAILIEDNSSFYTPVNIPEKKYKNASKRFLKYLLEDDDELLLFYDGSFFGSAKKGFALSPYKIYWSGYGYISCAGFAWEGLSDLTLDKYSLNLGKEYMIELTQTDMKKEVYNLIKILHNFSI